MYIFEAILSQDDSPARTLIIFSGQIEGDDFQYGARFERELEKYPVAPDRLIFIFPEYLSELIISLIDGKNKFYQNITRYGSKTSIHIVTFDGFGRLTEKANLHGGSDKLIDLANLSAEVIRQGIINLAMQRKDHVIQKSPPGTIFVKPSSDEHDEFIKASEMAIGYSQNQFVAYCLLSKRSREKDIKNIWIDSSSISVFVDCLIFYIYKFSGDVCKSIKYESFNSYEKLGSSKPSHVEDAWVIISASSSNNLGVKICSEWGLDNDQVVTILSYKSSDPEKVGDEILADISKLSSSRMHQIKKGTLIGVKVNGENFIPCVKDTNKVVIKKAHKPDFVDKSIYPFIERNVFLCNKIDKKGKVREIYIDLMPLVNDEAWVPIRQWIEETISWNFPLDTRWLVYEKSDPVSVLIVLVIKEKIKKMGFSSECQDIDLKIAETQITGDGAVAVIVPVISSAQSLLSLNRHLRISKHNGNRLFISIFSTAKSKHDHDTMINSVTFGPKGKKYSVFIKNALFVGGQNEKSSWQEELSLIENFSDAFWQTRATSLSLTFNGLVNQLGVPAAPAIAELGFSQDYAFWPPGYSPDLVNSSAVYVTVSCVLQKLRDKPYTNFDEDSLAGNIYQHSVIDPDNFLRFDDPLLQSCLWRAAKYTELDYSSSSELSDSFKTFMVRQINSYSTRSNNSTLDILVGVALSKIKITSECLVAIVHSARLTIGYCSAVIELLDYIERHILKLNVEVPLKDDAPF